MEGRSEYVWMCGYEVSGLHAFIFYFELGIVLKPSATVVSTVGVVRVVADSFEEGSGKVGNVRNFVAKHLY